MTQCIKAEFAGTRAEARAFAAQHGFNCARRFGPSPNALPIVSLSVPRAADVGAALSKFARHGWDQSSVWTRESPARPGRGRR